MYDPQPDEVLLATQGEWRGELSYRDYSAPDRMVTLPTRLFLSLLGPSSLALNFIYDDGPGKIVYSYEQMRFDFARNELRWLTGADKPMASLLRIVLDTRSSDGRRLVLERKEKDHLARFTLDLGARALALQKEEIRGAQPALLRNRYTFNRP
ncbi:hypothetical protein GCM10027296_18250 [Chitinimonas naiadis]